MDTFGIQSPLDDMDDTAFVDIFMDDIFSQNPKQLMPVCMYYQLSVIAMTVNSVRQYSAKASS